MSQRKIMPIPRYNITKRRLKSIPSQLMIDIESEIKAVLHDCRDCLRNQEKDTVRIPWDVNNGYYGEAFGIMRAMHIMGYGYFGPSNIGAMKDFPNKVYNIKQDQQNLKWWFHQLEEEVLQEEGFDGDHHCEYCMKRYQKDDAFLLEKKAQYDNERAGECGLSRPPGDA